MRKLAIIAVVLTLLGCERHYKIHFKVCDNTGVPLKNVQVFGESVNRELKLDIGQTDSKGEIDFGRVATKELDFEFRKDGYRNLRRKFKLRNEEPANYDVTLQKIESENSGGDNGIPE